MATFIFDLIVGGLLSLFTFLLGLFPSVNADDFMFEAPEGVREALSALNWFVPVSDLMAVFGVWLWSCPGRQCRRCFLQADRQGAE